MPLHWPLAFVCRSGLKPALRRQIRTLPGSVIGVAAYSLRPNWFFIFPAHYSSHFLGQVAMLLAQSRPTKPRHNR
jgi:hypothetical protein